MIAPPRPWSGRYTPPVFSAPVPSRDDVVVFELLRTPRGALEPHAIGTATFIGGRATVEAPENVAVAVEDLLARPFVDRVQADERPPGYRRSGTAAVDFLVPGMPEHFLARMRGLWLSYPDGSIVTARASDAAPVAPERRGGRSTDPVVTDPTLRLATLSASEQAIGHPLVKPNAPEPGLRPAEGPPPIGRTDCGWLC